MEAESKPEEFRGTSRFDVQRRIGAGAMGVVYQAFDRERNMKVALKTLRDIGPGSIYRLKQEFRSLADVAHPNLVSLYELVSAGDQWFFTMEFVGGTDFLRYVRTGHGLANAETIRDLREPGSSGSSEESWQHFAPGALDEGRLRGALRQLAKGVVALHHAGRLHRDIKPSNVMVTPEGRLVLLDFGLVAELTPDERTESIETIVGTAAYMAPEQAASRGLTPASDWYAVGAMLYEALTGQLPFRGKLLQVLMDKQQHEPPAPHSLDPTVPEDLNALCVALLRRAPEDRPSREEILRRLGANPSVARLSTLANVSLTQSALTGRDAEMAALEQAFADTLERRSLSVFVHGSSGMGKSALVRRFLDSIRHRAVILSGRCYERESVPYKAVDSLLEALCRHLAQMPPRETGALLPRDVGPLLRVFPQLKRVAALAEAPRPPIDIADAQELRRRAFAALRELLARLADRWPVVLYIDDLQWGDIDSGALLADLMRPPDAPTLLLVGCYRSEDARKSPLLQTLMSAQPVETRREIPIAALSPADARALALALLETDDADATAHADAVAREAGGSPFFVHELVHHLRAGAVAGTVSLEHVLLERVGRLPPEAQRLLEIVAVAGGPVPQVLAARAAGLESNETVTLAQLRAGRLVRTLGVHSLDNVEPYHDRIRETVAARLGAEALRQCNARLAAVLETWGEADPEILATHFFAAGQAERAGHWAAIAARSAAETLAFERAVRLYRSALELRTPEVERDRQLRVEYGDALVNAGRAREGAEQYLEAASGAEARTSLELRRRAAEQLLRSGHLERGTALLRDVLEAVGMQMPNTSVKQMASLLWKRARLKLRGSGYRERATADLHPEQLWRMDLCWSVVTGFALVDSIRTFDFLTRHVLLALEAGEPARIARSLAFEAVMAIGQKHDPSRAFAQLERARVLAERSGDARTIGFTSMASGIGSMMFGEWRKTLDFCDGAEAIFRDQCTGVAWELATSRFMGNVCLFTLGDLPELRRRVRALRLEVEGSDDVFARTHVAISWPNAVWLLDDDVPGAQRELDLAMQPWSFGNATFTHLNALVARVNIDLYVGDGEAARRRIELQREAIEGSLLLRQQSTRIEWWFNRGRAAIAAASDTRDAKAGALAIRMARRMEAEKMPWGDALASLLRAGAASVRDGQAREALDAAVATCERAQMPIHAAAARRQRGCAVGNAAEIGAIDEQLARGGVRRPGRLCAMLLPGFPHDD
jgi:serine/threonine protein kinase